MKLTLLSENHAEPPYQAEHGLSLFLEYHGKRFLFDTGSGRIFLENARRMGISPESADGIILSHGHYDHSGGLSNLPPGILWYAPGITVCRYSRHPGKPVKTLTMPEESRKWMEHSDCIEIPSFTEISDGVFLTGPIPRISGENCGGPFFLDPDGKEKDHLPDEQALLLQEGILIQGCCHAGIINTIEYCKQQKPEIRIRTVIGGLHLLLAEEKRLKQTADCLRENRIKTLYLLHCTGENAIDFLKKELPETGIFTPGVDGKPICL